MKIIVICSSDIWNLLFSVFVSLLKRKNLNVWSSKPKPYSIYRLFHVALLLFLFLCRRTDEHGGEEEEEAAQEPHHVQQQPAAGAGASVREDALPGRLRQGGPGPPGQPHRGPSPGRTATVADGDRHPGNSPLLPSEASSRSCEQCSEGFSLGSSDFIRRGSAAGAQSSWLRSRQTPVSCKIRKTEITFIKSF